MRFERGDVQPDRRRQTVEGNWTQPPRVVACLLAAVLSLSFAAPHRHRNPLGDLGSDSRSDSGDFVAAALSAPSHAGPVLSGAESLDDEQCPACFWSDMTPGHAAAFVLEVPAWIALPHGSTGTAVPRWTHLPVDRDRSPPSV
jgi:hypothetical protein